MSNSSNAPVVPTKPKHPQTDKERAKVLQNLLSHVKAEAVELISKGPPHGRKVLFTELETHIHLMRRTLDAIERGATP